VGSLWHESESSRAHVPLTDKELEYALYQLELKLGPGDVTQPVSWAVCRRYSEFESARRALLDAGVLSDVPGEAQLFPKKSMASSKSPAVVAERVELLPKWLVAISHSHSTSIHPAFRALLQLDQFERELAAASASLVAGANRPELQLMSTPPEERPLSLGGGMQTGAQTWETSASRVEGPPSRPSTEPSPTAAAGGIRGPGSPAAGVGNLAHLGVHASAGILPPRVPQRSPAARDPSLPLHASPEHETAHVTVPIRLPPTATLPTATTPLPREITQRAIRTISAVEEAEATALHLREEARKHEEAEAALRERSSVHSSEVPSLSAEADRLDGVAVEAEARAQELRAQARSAHLRAQQQAADAAEEARRAETERRSAMSLTEKGLAIANQAHVRRAEAIEEHEHATLRVLEAEAAVEQAARRELHRQVFEAAAASARARKLVRAAAAEKAAEEEAIMAGHEAAADLEAAKEMRTRADSAILRARKREAEAEALAAANQLAAHRHTQMAAQASAELVSCAASPPLCPFLPAHPLRHLTRRTRTATPPAWPTTRRRARAGSTPRPPWRPSPTPAFLPAGRAARTRRPRRSCEGGGGAQRPFPAPSLHACTPLCRAVHVTRHVPQTTVEPDDEERTCALREG